jgi:hypothetical protein
MELQLGTPETYFPIGSSSESLWSCESPHDHRAGECLGDGADPSVHGDRHWSASLGISHTIGSSPGTLGRAHTCNSAAFANEACAAASTLAVRSFGRVAFIIMGVALRATTWRMSPTQVPPSAARAGVETKPAAKRITKAKTGAGLARARQSGTKLGRRKVRQSVEATIREQRAKGDGILKIARTLGVGTSVVERVVLEPT